MPAPMMRNARMNGVINGSDASQSNMSYVDMHDLHPENVEAAKLNGWIDGGVSGAAMGGFAGFAAAYMSAKELVNGSRKITGSGWGITAAAAAVGALVMGAIRSFTARANAETHNQWSNRVVSRMEMQEQEQAQLAAMQAMSPAAPANFLPYNPAAMHGHADAAPAHHSEAVLDAAPTHPTHAAHENHHKSHAAELMEKRAEADIAADEATIHTR